MTFAMIGSERAPGILDPRPAVEPSAPQNATDADFLRLIVRQHIAACAPVDFHHIPGRLRLKSGALRQDPARLDAVCGAFGAVPGVRSATPNHLTGSILIEYDPLVLLPHKLSAALRECRSGDDTGAGLPWWAERATWKTIEWLFEKLAVALIAAVV